MIKSFFDKYQIDYSENISLKKYNTYRIDTKCQFLVFPSNIEQLIIILKEIKKQELKYLILGNGSNVIFSQPYYDGIIIKLDKLNKVEYDGYTITVEAGYSLIKLANDTINKGLSGLEFAAGIPGCVGASTAMNAGAYNCDMSSIIKSVKVLTPDLTVKILKNSELKFAYRDSFLKQNKDYIVLSTTIELLPGDIASMQKQVEERRIKRYNSQPLNMPSAGSVFRNPESMYAGELIENCHLKGCEIGGAKVSEKHANFIVNSNNATGSDVIKLIDKIQKEVKKQYNVELKLEQIIIE